MQHAFFVTVSETKIKNRCDFFVELGEKVYGCDINKWKRTKAAKKM